MNYFEFEFCICLFWYCVEPVTKLNSGVAHFMCFDEIRRNKQTRKIFEKIEGVSFEYYIRTDWSCLHTYFCCLMILFLFSFLVIKMNHLWRWWHTQRMLWYYHKHRKHLIKFSFFHIMHTILLPVFRLCVLISGGRRKGDETKVVYETISWLILFNRINRQLNNFFQQSRVFSVMYWVCKYIPGQLNQIRFVSCQIAICSMTYRHEFSQNVHNSKNPNTNTFLSTKIQQPNTQMLKASPNQRTKEK